MSVGVAGPDSREAHCSALPGIAMGKTPDAEARWRPQDDTDTLEAVAEALGTGSHDPSPGDVERAYRSLHSLNMRVRNLRCTYAILGSVIEEPDPAWQEEAATQLAVELRLSRGVSRQTSVLADCYGRWHETRHLPSLETEVSLRYARQFGRATFLHGKVSDGAREPAPLDLACALGAWAEGLLVANAEGERLRRHDWDLVTGEDMARARSAMAALTGVVDTLEGL